MNDTKRITFTQLAEVMLDGVKSGNLTVDDAMANVLLAVDGKHQLANAPTGEEFLIYRPGIITVIAQAEANRQRLLPLIRAWENGLRTNPIRVVRC